MPRSKSNLKPQYLDGILLRFHARRHGLNQKRLARRLRISSSYFCNLLQAREPVSLVLLNTLATLLNLSNPSQLLKNEDSAAPEVQL